MSVQNTFGLQVREGAISFSAPVLAHPIIPKKLVLYFEVFDTGVGALCNRYTPLQYARCKEVFMLGNNIPALLYAVAPYELFQTYETFFSAAS